MDRAGRLLQMVSEQMQAYSDSRSQIWHQTEGAEHFHDVLKLIIEVQGQIDELRSNF